MRKIYLAMALSLTVLAAGCGTSDKDTTTAAPTQEATQAPEVDAVTTASIVNDAASFEKAISADGTWIIAALNDINTSNELVLDGEFQNSRGETQRKIALYAQDENRNVTARYTLTAPKLTVKSPAAMIVNGTFVGDVYVETTDFQLIGATVDGNIIFASEEAKAGFTMDADSKVTGTQEVTK